MKATVYNGSTTRVWTPADTDVLSSSTPYVWVDAVVDDVNDPQLHELFTDLDIDDPVFAYLRKSDLAGVFQIVGDRVIGSTWAAPDTPAKHPVYIHVVWGAGSVVTLRQGGDKAVENARENIAPRGAKLFARPSVVPGVLMDLIFSSVDRRLTDIGDQMYALDEKIMVDNIADPIPQLRDIRDELSPWSQRIPPYAEQIQEALVDPQDLPGMDADGIHYLQAYSAHVSGTTNTVGDLGDGLHSVVQDYQSELSNSQGNRINQLTVVATIFLPISVLTGYFGMNFQWLTNETMTFASWVAMGVVLPIALVMFSTFLMRKDGFGMWMRRSGHHSKRARKHPLKD